MDYAELVPGGEGEEDRVILRATAMLDRRRRAPIVAIKQSRTGIEVKLADKLSALEKLGRYTGIFERGSGSETEELTSVRDEVFGDDE